MPPGGCTTSHLVSKIIIAVSRCVKKIFCRVRRYFIRHLLALEEKKLPPGNREGADQASNLNSRSCYVMYGTLLAGPDMRLDTVWLTASTDIGLSASANDYISHNLTPI
jgi:hypothetical protein